MTGSKSLGLSMVFLAIAVFVSSSLVLTVRGNHADGGAPLTQAWRLLQNT